VPADITTERLLASVTWEWQDVEELMEQLIPTVNPGTALRRYKKLAAGNKGTGTRRPLTEMEQVVSGARQIINERISSQVDGGRLELERDGRTRRVKFRERREVVTGHGACPKCNRPFEPATTEKKPHPSPPKAAPRQKVVYPKFPQWEIPASERSSG
jgi:hypothetical protein